MKRKAASLTSVMEHLNRINNPSPQSNPENKRDRRRPLRSGHWVPYQSGRQQQQQRRVSWLTWPLENHTHTHMQKIHFRVSPLLPVITHSDCCYSNQLHPDLSEQTLGAASSNATRFRVIIAWKRAKQTKTHAWLCTAPHFWA